MQLPYTYIDVATLTIDNTTGTWQIGVWDDSEGASINAPTDRDAVALARAVLAAAGNTGCEVVAAEDMAKMRQAAMEAAATVMRERAADEVVRYQHGLNTDPEAAIRALSLLPAPAPLTADNDA